MIAALGLAASAAGAASFEFNGFGSLDVWHGDLIRGSEVPLTGDFNGDGLDDVARLVPHNLTNFFDVVHNTEVFVALSGGTHFGTPSLWCTNIFSDTATVLAGDVNGDGRDDLIGFEEYLGIPPTEQVGVVFVALSTGTNFSQPSVWKTDFHLDTQVPLVGDFNGDGRADIACAVQEDFNFRLAGDVYVALSTGTGFGGINQWCDRNFSFAGEVPRAGDLDGDGRADLATFVFAGRFDAAPGDVWAVRSKGTNFATALLWASGFATGNDVPFLGDVDADGRSDAVSLTPGPGWVNIARSLGIGFGAKAQFFGGCASGETPALLEANGDLNADCACFTRTSLLGHAAGEARVALNGGPSLPEPSSRLATFGHATMKVNGKRASGARPLLTLLLEYSDQRLRAPHTNGWFAQRLFGAYAATNVAGYFLEMSKGDFTFTNAGILGPFTAPDYPASTVADESTFACATLQTIGTNLVCPDVTNAFTPADWAAGVDRAWERIFDRAVEMATANAGFNYTAFDSNSDGLVTPDELTILLIGAGPAPWACGTTRFRTVTIPGQGVTVSGRISSAGEGSNLSTITHELSHTLETKDLYGARFRQNNNLTLMDATCAGEDDLVVYHLDPWHKLRLGWIEPRIYSLADPGGCASLDSPQLAGPIVTAGKPLLLYHPSRGSSEYFLIEFRARTNSFGGLYDTSVGDQGVVIWHVQENPDHSINEINAFINAGADGVLDSVIAPGSDDVFFTNPPPGTVEIRFGLDGILQSTKTLDDQYETDGSVWAFSPPNGRRSNTSTAWRSQNGLFSLHWFDNTDVGVRLRVGAMPNPTDSIEFEWGRNRAFVPFLTGVSNSVVLPGETVVVTGSLGAASSNRLAVLVNRTNVSDRFPLVRLGAWHCESVTFAVTEYTPPGEYVLQTESQVTNVSNRLPLTVLPSHREDFSTGNAGWRHVGLPESGPYITPTFGPLAAFYFVEPDAAGHPNGHIYVEDIRTNAASYFEAPLRFLGRMRGAYQQSLGFDLRDRNTTPHFADADVLLVGAGRVLMYHLGTPPGNVWTHFDVPFVANTGWHIGSLAGPAPDQFEFEETLSDLNALRIRASQRQDSPSFGGLPVRIDLDNVTLNVTPGHGGPQYGTSDFTAGDDGWMVVEVPINGPFSNVIAGPLPVTYVNSGGNPGPYLRAVDFSGDADRLSYFQAPAKFLGFVNARGQALCFSARVEYTNSPIAGPDVVLVGAGRTLVCDAGPEPGSEWTSYCMPLVADGRWRLDTLSGPPATRDDLDFVLGNLEAFRLRADYQGGSDAVHLDTVKLGSLSDNAAHYWAGEGNAGDQYGFGFGMEHSLSYVAGHAGQAFAFNGTNAYLDFYGGGGNFGADDFTIEFYLQTASTRKEAIFDKRFSCDPGSYWALRVLADGKLGVEFSQDSSCSNCLSLVTSNVVNDGVWHHVAVVRRATNVTCYVDGALSAQGSTLGITVITGFASLFAGNSPCTGFNGGLSDGTGFFTGNLDEIQLHPCPLSATQIAAIGGRPRLFATSAGPGFVTISWTPTNVSGFVLQQSTTLAPPAWTNAPSGVTNPVTVPATLPTQFYRLVKP